jgi:myo-inositol-1(or 4)-monophosphatase
MLDFAVDISRKAGEILLSHFGRIDPAGVFYKSKRNPVTIADTESEDFLVNAIRSRFPEHSILTEERKQPKKSSEFEWVIDPLDGTVNFVHGLPVFCVSIALMRRRVIEIGVVYAPALGEIFTAKRGQGAFASGKKIRVSQTSDLLHSLLATGFAYIREETSQNNQANFNRLNLKAHGVRRLGSAALDLCYVACGRFDGFWELHLSPWDVAAGSLIVTEAGGKVTEIDGGDNYIYGQNIVASNSIVHSLICENLDPFTPESTPG